MKVVAVNPNKTYEQIFGDESDPNETVFILKPLTQAELAEIQDVAPHLDGTRNTLALTHGLKGWRGVVDSEGNEIPFPPGGSGPAMELLPTRVKNTLVYRILTGPDAPEPKPAPKTGSPPESGDG